MRTFLYYLWDSLVIYFTSPQWERTLIVLKILSVLISLALIFGIVVLLMRMDIFSSRFWRFVRGTEIPRIPKGKVRKRWEAILARLQSNEESNYKLAVIEADKLLDDILKRVGYQGETMGDRLKKITTEQLTNIDEVWRAHKVRNNIVHDVDFKLNQDQARKTVETLEKALKEMEAI